MCFELPAVIQPRFSNNKSSNAIRTVDGSAHSIFWPERAIQDRVRIYKEIANACLFQNLFQPGIISTFREPDSPRSTTKCLFVVVCSYVNLSPYRSLRNLNERQKSMRRRTRNNFKLSRVLKRSKGRIKISSVLFKGKLTSLKFTMVHHSGFME